MPEPSRLTTHDSRLVCHLLDTGYCVADEATILRGARRRKIACHAPVALLGHPRHGWTLFDAGYAPRILDATRGWPFRLYRLATPLRLPARGAVVDQLGALGLEPGDIRRIVVSHFHADHIAGLRDFPHARFVASRAAWEDASARRGVRALLRGVIPALIPDDFAARADLLDPFTWPPLPALGPTHDLFGDGSALLVDLPGHARGQIGLLARTERGPLLLAADGCWLSRSYRERHPPAAFAGLIADDARALATTMERLHAFAAARLDVAILPTHCPDALGRELRREAAWLDGTFLSAEEIADRCFDDLLDLYTSRGVSEDEAREWAGFAVDGGDVRICDPDDVSRPRERGRDLIDAVEGRPPRRSMADKAIEQLRAELGQ